MQSAVGEELAVDELRSALKLATDDELRDLTEILFRRKFNPLDYVNTPDPVDVQCQERDDWLNAIEHRFRFLAADGVTVLSRNTGKLSYRQILIQVCRYLKLPYRSSMSTTDLEAEIFLNLLARAWKQMPASEKGELSIRLKRSLTHSQILPQLPTALQQDPMSVLVKGSSALAVTSVLRPILLHQIARQFAIQFATYQAAQQAVALGGAAAASQFQHQIAVQMARRGMAANAARYTAVRGVFAVVGPALWAWFFADLGWRAIATNYGRIIPIIYALAQIRLTRSECFEPAY